MGCRSCGQKRRAISRTLRALRKSLGQDSKVSKPNRRLSIGAIV